MNLKTALKFAIVILVLCVLFVLSYALRAQHRASQDAATTSTDTSGINDMPTDDSSTPLTTRYEYEDEQPGSEWVSGGNNDGKIYEINLVTNTRTLIVPSVKALSKAVSDKCGCKFVKIAESKTNPYLYFGVTFIEGMGGIYRFDGLARTITELKTSPYFEISSGEVSPYGPYIATIQNPKNYEDGTNLYLLDLDKDELKTLTNLTGNQTFNICQIDGCLGSLGANIEWLNKNEFVINIYDTENFTYDEQTGQRAKLLEKRKFKIN